MCTCATAPPCTQTCADMARYFGRVIVMPNLTPAGHHRG